MDTRREMLSAFCTLVSHLPPVCGEENEEEIERYLSDTYGEDVLCQFFVFEDFNDYLNHAHSTFNSIAPIICVHHLRSQDYIIVAYLFD